MKKIIFALIFALFCFLPVVFATQTLTIDAVPSPANNPQKIDWTYSDSLNLQTQQCDIFYSTSPSFSENPLTSTSCSNICTIPQSTYKIASSLFNTTGLTAASALNLDFITFFKLNNNFNVMYGFNNAVNASLLFAKTWNPTSNQWDDNFALSNFPDFNRQCSGAACGARMDVLDFEGKTKLFFSAANANLTAYFFDWNGYGWQQNSDGNGLKAPASSFLRRMTYSNFFYDGYKMVILDINNVAANSNLESFVFDADTRNWNLSSQYLKDFNSAFTGAVVDYGFTTYKDVLEPSNSNIFLFGGTPEPDTVGYSGSNFKNGSWQNDKTVSQLLKSRFSIFDEVDSYSDDQNNFFVLMNITGTAITYGIYEISKVSYDYSSLNNCSIDFDTTGIKSGYYYIDVNVNNFTSSILKTSNPFLILSEDYYSQLIIHDIENISHSIDKNVIILTPTDPKKDFKFSIDANGFSGSVFFKIKNTDKSLKQYFAHTAGSNEYLTNTWNFNDTITFGSNPYNAIQKIWNNSNAFEYNWSDVLVSDDNRFYNFRYQETMKSWYSINNSEWANQLPAATIDYNGIPRDLFSVSIYSNLKSYLIEELPKISATNLNKVNYVFQLNTYSDTATSATFKADTIQNTALSPARNYQTLTSERRITIKDLNQNFLTLETTSTTANNFYFGLYNLIERGYFTKDLKILDFDNSALPVLITDANEYYSYIKEGSNFRIFTEVNDPDGKLDYYEISAYVDVVNDTNKVKYWKKYFDSTGRIELNDLLDGIIDLTANAPNRNIRITVRVVDSNSGYSETQSQVIKLRQFPSTPEDLRFTFTQNNHKVGDKPSGKVNLYTTAANNIIGIEFQLESINQDGNVSDYNRTYYKGQDFSCLGIDCSFDYTFENYAFPREDNYILKAWALVKTENKSNTNNFLFKQQFFPVYFKIFETLRIWQSFERTDFKYNNDEAIGLVLQARDSDYSNLKNDLDVKIRLWECSNDTIPADDCFLIDLNYSPDGFLYDSSTGFNQWFFRQIFLESDYTALSDGNYFRVEGIVEDKEKKHQFVLNPLLTGRCETGQYGTNFWGNMIQAFNYFWAVNPCNTYTPPIVSLDQNASFEKRIIVDNARVRTSPTQECFACANVDTNNIYANSLEQDIRCVAIYTLGEKPIDKFNLLITNPFSDLSEKKYPQYLSVSVPYENVYYNDVSLMRLALERERSTSIDTIGKFIQAGFNYLAVSGLNTVISIPEGLQAAGIITNIGSDCNFSQAFSPDHISGAFWYEVHGLKIINQKDYEITRSEIKNLNPQFFLRYAKTENLSVPDLTTTIDVYANDMTKIQSSEIPSYFIINEVIKNNPIQTQNLSDDENANAPKYTTAPTLLKFNFISDLIFNNERSTIRSTVPMTLTAILTKNCGILGLSCSVGGISDLIFKGDITWLVQNVWYIFFIAVAILFVAIVYRSVKSGNTINVFNMRRKN